ncbi:MAG: hypothetical protein ACR2NZ_15350 [Rubripirellula sp.]
MTLSANSHPSEITLDIGGEGRHADAWNLNPSHVKTLGPSRGEPIPNHIPGRAEKIPFESNSIDRIIVERSPLLLATIHEIARVIHEQGTITLVHALSNDHDPHQLARAVLPGSVRQRQTRIGNQRCQETVFAVGMQPNDLLSAHITATDSI